MGKIVRVNRRPIPLNKSKPLRNLGIVTLLLTAFMIFLPKTGFCVTKKLYEPHVSDPTSDRFICKSQIGAFIYASGLDNELEGYAKEGTDTFSIFIGDEEVYFTPDDRALDGSFKVNGMTIVEKSKEHIVAISHQLVKDEKLGSGAIAHMIILNRNTGVGSWVLNSIWAGQNMQAYSFTCKSVR